jgi:hypothetical protein
MTTQDKKTDLPFQPQPEGVRMPADNCRSQLPSNLSTRRVGRLMSLHEKTLVTGAIVGFGILHIVGGTMLQPAVGKSPLENTMPVRQGD